MTSKTIGRRSAAERGAAHGWARPWLCSVSALALAVAATARPSVASDWTGGVSDAWSSAANWDTNVVPTAATSVSIDTQGAGWPVIDGTNEYAEVVRIGVSAAGGNLLIHNAGTLSSLSADIGLNSVGSATVSGAGSLWAVATHMELGFLGTGTLTIQNGGAVTSQDGYLSNRAAGSGTVNVTTGGSWTNSRELFVGYQGTGVLNVATGGTVSSVVTTLGFYGASTGTVTVDGTGSTLTNSGNLIVGREGTGTLTVTNGGVVSNSAGLVGRYAGSSGSVSVDGADSRWNNVNNLAIGVEGQGTLSITNGAAVTNYRGFIAEGDGSSGSVTVSGSGSTWTNTSDLWVGGEGDGSLTIEGGAQVLSDGGVIGRYGAGSGTVLVTGTNSVWDLGSGTLLVGFGGDGQLTVSNGGLVDGRINVSSNGVLRGNGTVGQTYVSAGGVVAPGLSIGTLNVAGDINFDAGSIYEAEVNAAGQSDRIDATGAATLNGGQVRVLAQAGLYAASTPYTILTAAGGLTGAFDSVTSNFAFLNPALSYDANNAYLTLTRNAFGFGAVGATPNQVATGDGVDSLGFGNPLYDAVLYLALPQAQHAFDQLSGEIYASARSAFIEDSGFVRAAALDRLRTAFEDGAPAGGDRLAAWGHGFGSWGETDGDGNAAKLDRVTGGIIVGADARAFEAWRVGAIAAYSRTDFDADERRSSGESENYSLGLYGGRQWGALAWRSGGAYTWHDADVSRAIVLPSFSDNVTGQFDAETLQVFSELGFGFKAGGVRYEPFGNVAYVNLSSDSLRETGGAAALAIGGGSMDTAFTTLGVRAAADFSLGALSATAKGTIGWRHGFGDISPSSSVRFASGGNAFSIGGVPIAEDVVVVEAGLDFTLSPAATLGVSANGQYGSGAVDQTVRANLDVKF
ncbi:autotransporter domain-containing protein [Hyphomicrobium sp. LHD-15]|uniref:autotransporter outer membrane beta-barrel domain-containing protein n=1 Tax=Hyphomicrobium sp. LHD-15 TaxID=3072142 RepID=UPI00280E110A|nr:autotransporter domain-containing protein [Hyphomicrobium sp. LHD-15]MDQ8700554.1 autotransporter domain-containing protein [Hyphomicrobium sp. LHD-15]